ncbi:hypothetical protein HRI_000767700 [Hibiscus trionum]|uniref:Uncharacterized protein n=1 Tax=Hibiscus trionum TaxID=183268 RepID=A0A9W7LNG1_HIBTR|nr:hypothetical protein HRI_000767700 [Hibiscus trionum]
MQSMKDAAASAKAGMEKAKATMQEKVDQMKTSDPTEKQISRERKEDRIEDAELRKQEARLHNATAGHGAGAGAGIGYNRAGTAGYGGGGVHDVNPIGGTGFTTGGLHHNRGDTGGYGGGGVHDHDTSRGYPTADTGTGYNSGRQVGTDENMNMGYGGDTGGGLGYSTTGGNLGGSGEPNNPGRRNLGGSGEPNNPGRRNTRGTQDDPYYRSY